jgi:hypothetical protein
MEGGDMGLNQGCFPEFKDLLKYVAIVLAHFSWSSHC